MRRPGLIDAAAIGYLLVLLAVRNWERFGDRLPFSPFSLLAFATLILAGVFVHRGLPIWRGWLSTARTAPTSAARWMAWFWVLAFPLFVTMAAVLVWSLTAGS